MRTFPKKGFQRGAATSAAKMGLTVGKRVCRRGYGEVSETQLIADLNAGIRRFWAKRAWLGVYHIPAGFEAQFKAARQRKERAA